MRMKSIATKGESRPQPDERENCGRDEMKEKGLN